MYFKSPDNRSKINIPLGYKGNAFPTPSQPRPAPAEIRQAPPTDSPKISEKALEKLKEAPPLPPSEPPESCEVCELKNAPPKRSILGGILSPEGSFEAEDLLILALALIIFQGGKENELALLLLALLFIK